MERVEKSIEVQRPVSTVYNQWTQFEQFPRFMDGVQEVRQLDDTHLHWRATIGGKDTQWDAEILEQLPDRRISWRSTSGAPNAGVVTFEPVDGEGTSLCVRIEYDPQGLAETVGDLFGIVSRQVQNTVEAFKDLIEHRGNETGAWRGEVYGGRQTSDARAGRAAEGADSPQTIPPGRAAAIEELWRTPETASESRQQAGARSEAKPKLRDTTQTSAPPSGRAGEQPRTSETALQPRRASRSRDEAPEDGEMSRSSRAGRRRFRVWDDPFEIMRTMLHEMDRPFASLGWPGHGRWHDRANRPWSPRVDIAQHGEELVITAELPGIKKEDLSLELDDDALVLRGERRSETDSEDGGVLRCEREYGSFYRTVPLPNTVDPATIKATIANGVLRVAMRAPQQRQRGRRVPIQETSPSGGEETRVTGIR